MWVPGGVSQVMSVRGVGRGEACSGTRKLSHSGPSTPATFFTSSDGGHLGIKAAVVGGGLGMSGMGGGGPISPQRVWAVASQGLSSCFQVCKLL